MTWAPFQTPRQEHEAVAAPVHCSSPAPWLFFLLHLLHRRAVLSCPPHPVRGAAVTSLPSQAVPATCYDQYHFRWYQLAWARNGFSLIILPSAPISRQNLRSHWVPVPLLTHAAASSSFTGSWARRAQLNRSRLHWAKVLCADPPPATPLRRRGGCQVLRIVEDIADITKPLHHLISGLLSSNSSTTVPGCVCSTSGQLLLWCGLPSWKSLT